MWLSALSHNQNNYLAPLNVATCPQILPAKAKETHHYDTMDASSPADGALKFNRSLSRSGESGVTIYHLILLFPSSPTPHTRIPPCFSPSRFEAVAQVGHSFSRSVLMKQPPLARRGRGQIRFFSCFSAIRGSTSWVRGVKVGGGGWVRRKMLSGSGLLAYCNLCKCGALLITADLLALCSGNTTAAIN